MPGPKSNTFSCYIKNTHTQLYGTIISHKPGKTAYLWMVPHRSSDTIFRNWMAFDSKRKTKMTISVVHENKMGSNLGSISPTFYHSILRNKGKY
jgi:hypothetical protein